jgi:DnaD/phage-associated family protein
MNIQLQYGTAVATVPAAALAVLDRATQDDLKVLLTLCAKPALMTGNSFGECVGNIAAEVGCTPARVEASLSFWRGAGVMTVTEENGKTAPATQVSANEVPVLAPETPAEEPKETRPARPQPSFELPRYTSAQLAELMEARTETATYLRECQNIWGKLFNTHEHNIILGLVDYLGLDWDYVLALLSYAVKYYRERENQGKSLQYVENMAFAFHKEGIVTAEALQNRFKEMEAMSSMEHKLRQLFGMGEGALTPAQKKHFSTWVYDYRYDMEIITYAYNRAVDNTGSTKITYIMRYMSKTLGAWNAEDLRTLEQIEAADAAFHAERDGKKAAETPSGSFNTDDFFAAAVRRSFGDDFDPDKQGT